MKKLLLILFLIATIPLSQNYVQAEEVYVDDSEISLPLSVIDSIINKINFEWRAMVVPPAHEPVIGNKVARYLLEVTPGYEDEYLRFGIALKAWGVNTWLHPDVRGHGWDKFTDSDYSVDEWRMSTTTRLEIGPEKFHFTTEYYKPINSGEWGGHGLERHYYWLVGFGGRYK